MTSRIQLKIGGQNIARGERKDIFLPLSETYTGDAIRMPVHVIRSRKAGPTIFVTAAIHGDEINGTGIIHDFLFGDPVELKCGTLILVPVVNVLGFEANMRYLPDRRDLNRSFPGNRNGSQASRVAFTLMSEIVSKCDYGIDLHSAASQRTNYPNVRANLAQPAIRELALAFGCALVVDGNGPLGSFRREATKSGCPTIILEAGEPFKIEPSVLDIGVRGIRNVLAHFGMLNVAREEPPFQVTIRKTSWLRASVGGILKFHVAPGAFVEEGQAISTNYSLLGKEQQTLVAPFHGVVLGMATMPAVKPGEPICHLAVLSKRQVDQFRKSLLSPASGPHQRAQRHLATNMDVVDHD